MLLRWYLFKGGVLTEVREKAIIRKIYVNGADFWVLWGFCGGFVVGVCGGVWVIWRGGINDL